MRFLHYVWWVVLELVGVRQEPVVVPVSKPDDIFMMVQPGLGWSCVRVSGDNLCRFSIGFEPASVSRERDAEVVAVLFEDGVRVTRSWRIELNAHDVGDFGGVERAPPLTPSVDEGSVVKGGQNVGPVGERPGAPGGSGRRFGVAVGDWVVRVSYPNPVMRSGFSDSFQDVLPGTLYRVIEVDGDGIVIEVPCRGTLLQLRFWAGNFERCLFMRC